MDNQLEIRTRLKQYLDFLAELQRRISYTKSKVRKKDWQLIKSWQKQLPSNNITILKGLDWVLPQGNSSNEVELYCDLAGISYQKLCADFILKAQNVATGSVKQSPILALEKYRIERSYNKSID